MGSSLNQTFAVTIHQHHYSSSISISLLATDALPRAPPRMSRPATIPDILAPYPIKRVGTIKAFSARSERQRLSRKHARSTHLERQKQHSTANGEIISDYYGCIDYWDRLLRPMLTKKYCDEARRALVADMFVMTKAINKEMDEEVVGRWLKLMKACVVANKTPWDMSADEVRTFRATIRGIMGEHQGGVKGFRKWALVKSTTSREEPQTETSSIENSTMQMHAQDLFAPGPGEYYCGIWDHGAPGLCSKDCGNGAKRLARLQAEKRSGRPSW